MEKVSHSPPEAAADGGLHRWAISMASEEERERLVEILAEMMGSAFSLEKNQELFLLCLIEAVNNAAEHGNRNRPDGKVELELLLLDGLAGATVLDQGPGFTPFIPDLKTVRGNRGRGLGFIQQFCQTMFFNLAGNRITFFKGGTPMILKLTHATASVSLLPADTVVVSDFQVKSDVYNAVSELFDELDKTPWKAVYLNFKEVKLLNSSAWGTLFAESDRVSTEQIILFNTGEALWAAADAMGLTNPQGRFANIRVVGSDNDVWRLLVDRLSNAQDTGRSR